MPDSDPEAAAAKNLLRGAAPLVNERIVAIAALQVRDGQLDLFHKRVSWVACVLSVR